MPAGSSRASPALHFSVSGPAWILPLTLLLLAGRDHAAVHSPPSPALPNVAAAMEEHGFAGPFSALGQEELDMAPKMRAEWEDFWGALRDRVVAEGFGEPPKRDCFLWLPDCYNLATHPAILQIVHAIVGPAVLVHGMTLWHNESEFLSQFHMDLHTGDCLKGVNVLIGSNLVFIKHSQRLVARTAIRKVADTIKSLNEKSLAKPLEERNQFIEPVLISLIKHYTSKSDVHPVNIKIGMHDFLIFNSKAVYHIAEMVRGTALLIQFMAAECKVRDTRSVSWGIHRMQRTLFMLPCLIASDENISYSVNDVQQGLYTRGGSIIEDSSPVQMFKHPFFVNNLSVFWAPTPMSTWYHKTKHLRVYNYGIVSTSVLPELHLDNFVFLEGNKDVTYKTTSFEQIIIVVSGILLYRRTVNIVDYYEAVELVEGSVAYIASGCLHALTPASNGTSYISIRWIGKMQQECNTNSKEQFSGSVIDAIEGRTHTLNSGQAYDPDNEACDVILVMIKGSLSEILPSGITLRVSDVALVPAGKPCVFWNIGRKPVSFFVTHLCRFENDTCSRDLGALTVYAASGKLM